MTEPIFDPDYWKKRLRAARKGELHHSIFRCGKDLWERIEKIHRDILQDTVGDSDSVLDCGCGYGRLLTLMPETWYGDYTGLDLSPDFVEEAKLSYPERRFLVCDLRSVPLKVVRFDWAILISMRPMVLRNAGEEEWGKMEAEVRRLCSRILYLEYDPNDRGSVE